MAALNTLADDLLTKVFANTLVSAVELSVDATYKKVTTGAFNPSTGQVTKTEADVALKVIKRNEATIPFGGVGGSGEATNLATINESSDYLEFMVRPVTGVLPTQGIDDELTIDSKVYKIINVDSVNLGGNRLLYKIKAIG